MSENLLRIRNKLFCSKHILHSPITEANACKKKCRYTIKCRCKKHKYKEGDHGKNYRKSWNIIWILGSAKCTHHRIKRKTKHKESDHSTHPKYEWEEPDNQSDNDHRAMSSFEVLDNYIMCSKNETHRYQNKYFHRHHYQIKLFVLSVYTIVTTLSLSSVVCRNCRRTIYPSTSRIVV